jgi:hypothetical protein
VLSGGAKKLASGGLFFLMNKKIKLIKNIKKKKGLFFYFLALLASPTKAGHGCMPDACIPLCLFVLFCFVFNALTCLLVLFVILF